MGFDVITTLSDEAANPVRDVPLAVRDNNLAVTLIYFATAFALSSIARLEQFHPETAFAEAFTHIGMPWVTIIIYFCAFVGITATCFSQHIVSYYHVIIFRRNPEYSFRKLMMALYPRFLVRSTLKPVSQ